MRSACGAGTGRGRGVGGDGILQVPHGDSSINNSHPRSPGTKISTPLSSSHTHTYKHTHPTGSKQQLKQRSLRFQRPRP